MPKFKLNSLIKKPSDRQLLSLWQEVVKTRAKYRCEYPNCIKNQYLNAHHIYSRSHKSTRYDPDNGICLCSGHHSLNNNSAHKNPDFKEIIINSGIRSKQFWDILERKAKAPAKIDPNMEKLYLEQELRKLSQKVA